MKVTYELNVKASEKRQVKINEKESITINNIQINWVTNENFLEKIQFVSNGERLYFDNNGMPMQGNNDLKVKVFKLANYISNQFFIQTNIDAFENPFSISVASLNPETKEENDEINFRKPKSFSCHGYFDTIRIVVNPSTFSPEKYNEQFLFSDALQHFTDAKRITNPFLKFELYYKVIEFFYEERYTNKRTGKISSHVNHKKLKSYICRYIPNISKKECQYLGQVRNRITHPKATLGHLNCGNLDHINIVRSNIDLLERIASTLIKNPPEKLC